MAHKNKKHNPIIILGAERSGTSAVAEMVHRWGAYAGESEKMHEADEHNPQGYWEYLPVWDLLVELGDFAAGASWWDASFQQRVKEKVSIPQYRDKALALIAVMEKEGKPWFWKDPALSFFLSFWKEIWGDATYIITVRNPSDLALSWQKFVLPPKQKGVSLIATNILRWQYMMLLILEHTDEVENKIFIAYEGLVQEPRKQAKRLYEFLSRNDRVELSDDTQVDVMAQAVNPELWHNRNQILFDQVQEATAEQKALYQFIVEKIQDPSKKFEQSRYPMYAGWQEFVKNGEAFIRPRKCENKEL